MSRSTMAALARPTSASTSPVTKWTTLSVSRLSYGSPQRSTGMRITVALQIGLCARAGLVDADCRGSRDLVERPHAADPVPRVLLARRLPLALVPLGEPGDEELLRQRGQQDPPGLADLDQPVVVLELHHLGHGPRL